jgi:hypothetical protein
MHVFVYERNMMKNSFKYSKLFFIISKQKSALYVFFLPKQGTLSCVLYNLEASAIVMICALWAVIVMIVLLLDLQLMIYIIKCLDMWYMYIVSLVTIYKRHNIYEKKNFCQMSF